MLARLRDSATIPALPGVGQDRQNLTFHRTVRVRFEPAVEEALIRLRDPAVLLLLRAYLRDGEDYRTLQFAMEFLVRLDDLGAVPILRRLRESAPVTTGHTVAICALATLLGKAALPEIRTLALQTRDDPARVAAIDVVGRSKDAECVPTLRQLAHRPGRGSLRDLAACLFLGRKPSAPDDSEYGEILG